MRHHMEIPKHMKAKLPSGDVQNGKNLSNGKEMTSAFSVVGLKKGQMSEIITVRAWMGRSNQASTVYCSIWVRGDDVWYSGHGTAGGYGYHKLSAALDDAIASAGIELFGTPYQSRGDSLPDMKSKCRISGVGETAMRSALAAIGKALGYTKMLLCEH